MSMKTLAARIQYLGGDQLSRINTQKRRSLHYALKNDYNSRLIKTPYEMAIHALINENHNEREYDKKNLSVDFDARLKPGDVIEVLEDGTRWLIYLPYRTETAYLRTQIIRCQYNMEIDGITYWFYFQGPLENDISWYLKKGININELNYKGKIFIKKDEHTLDYFHRFKKFKIEGHTWETQVVDRITVEGVLEVMVREYFDDVYENLPEIHVEPCCTDTIVGMTEVRQDMQVSYAVRKDFINPEYHWFVRGNDRVKVIHETENGDACTVQVYDGAIRTFDIVYGRSENHGMMMTVSINIDEPEIKGPDFLYPFDTATYTTDQEGEFFIVDGSKAKILDQDGTKCIIEVLASKKGSFFIHFRPDGAEEDVAREIKIKSL